MRDIRIQPAGIIAKYKQATQDMLETACEAYLEEGSDNNAHKLKQASEAHNYWHNVVKEQK